MPFTVEMGPDKPSTRCDCCGHETRHVHGYVYRDGDARAVYFASWTLHHPDRGIAFSVGLGEWGEGSGPEDRSAFSLEFRQGSDGRRGFRLEDASRFVREEAVILGRPQDRDEALGHPLKEELFAVCDVLLTEETRIRDFLEGR